MRNGSRLSNIGDHESVQISEHANRLNQPALRQCLEIEDHRNVAVFVRPKRFAVSLPGACLLTNLDSPWAGEARSS